VVEKDILREFRSALLTVIYSKLFSNICGLKNDRSFCKRTGFPRIEGLVYQVFSLFFQVVWMGYNFVKSSSTKRKLIAAIVRKATNEIARFSSARKYFQIAGLLCSFSEY